MNVAEATERERAVPPGQESVGAPASDFTPAQWDVLDFMLDNAGVLLDPAAIREAAGLTDARQKRMFEGLLKAIAVHPLLAEAYIQDPDTGQVGLNLGLLTEEAWQFLSGEDDPGKTDSKEPAATDEVSAFVDFLLETPDLSGFAIQNGGEAKMCQYALQRIHDSFKTKPQRGRREDPYNIGRAVQRNPKLLEVFNTLNRALIAFRSDDEAAGLGKAYGDMLGGERRTYPTWELPPEQTRQLVYIKARASCKGSNPKKFYPPKNGTAAAKQAREICATCVVRTECLDFAIEANINDGIWGGEAARSIRRLRRARNVAKAAAAAEAAQAEAALQAANEALAAEAVA